MLENSIWFFAREINEVLDNSMAVLVQLKWQVERKATYILHGYYANFLIKVVLSLI
jgi:hypothetical protein